MRLRCRRTTFTRREIERRAERCTHLLTKANAGAGVEGQEDEGVAEDVGPMALVQEAVRIEFKCCKISIRSCVELKFGPTCRPPQVGTPLHQEDGIEHPLRVNRRR